MFEDKILPWIQVGNIPFDRSRKDIAITIQAEMQLECKNNKWEQNAKHHSL